MKIIFSRLSGSLEEIARKNGREKSFFYLAIIAGSVFLILSSYSNYLFFHVLVEMFTVVIAFGIFAVAWASRRHIDNNFLLILGIGYFFVGAFDTVHALSYKGMGVFPGITSNVPTQLWIIARYMEAFTFFGALLFLREKASYDRTAAFRKSGFIFAAYAAAFALILLSVFYWKIFPAAYVEGIGLTAFKKASEYVISLLLLASVIFLFRKGKALDSQMANLISLALIVKIASEISFTGYVGVYDFANVLGHIFKFISFLILYKAVLQIGLMRPYDFLFKSLKENEERLKHTQEIARLGSWELDLVKNKLTWSEEAYRIFGLDARGSKMTYETFLDLVHPEDRQTVDRAYSDSVRQKKDAYDIEHRIVRKNDGQIRFVHEKCEHFRNEKGEIIRSAGMVHDITGRKEAERKLAEARAELQKRTEERLAESYAYLGIVNRKISMLLDLEKHSSSRKNKQEIVDYVLNSASTLSGAKTSMLYGAVGKNYFSLISSAGLSKEKIADMQMINGKSIGFISEMISEQKRKNGLCERDSSGTFNGYLDVNYYVAIPLLAEKRCKGFLFLGFKGGKSLENHELEFLDVFAKHVSAALGQSGILN